ncbi:SH3 domain-containing protein (plasmid) [Limimaricola variabilis]
MRRPAIAATIMLMLLSGCAGSGTRTVVKGAGPDELLNLRAGPGLDYSVILGIPDGTPLIRRNCVTEVGQLWCRVSLADTPEITGYVSEDYLSDS